MNIKTRVVFSIFLSVLLLTFSSEIYAQSNDAEAEKLVSLADEMYNYGDKKEARGVYENALVMNPAHVRANFMVGTCYLETIKKPQGLKYFLKTYELDDKYSDKILYYIAECYHLGHDLDNAIIYYKKYGDQAKKDFQKKILPKSKYEEIEKDIERQVFECLNGKDLIRNPVRVKIENLGRRINGAYAEYTPAINAEENLLIFTSGDQEQLVV